MDKVKFTFEYLFRASPAMLYKFLSTSDCLIRWYCDEVDITGKEYIFVWDGSEEIAFLIEDRENELLRYRWEDADTKTEYLEFKMSMSPVTGDSILEVSDFCEKDEVEDQRQLWETQIKRLRAATGG